jgi:hypothetical protein
MEAQFVDSLKASVEYLESIINTGWTIGHETDRGPDYTEDRKNKPGDWAIEEAIKNTKAITANVAWDFEKKEHSQIDWQQIDTITAYMERLRCLNTLYTDYWEDGQFKQLNNEIIVATIQLRRFEAIRPKEEVSQQQIGPKTIPDELNTQEGLAILEKAIIAGFCDRDYNWMKPHTIVLCAYFSKKACKALTLKVKTLSNGEQTTNWKPFETLFGYNSGQLRTAEQSWLRDTFKRKRDDFYPDGADKIDALF